MSEKVLLVDDEEDFLDVMAERMRARGIEVSTTTSATHALEMVEEESFDAIVMDLMMPELEGTEALKAIKNKKRELQVILLTGYVTLEQVSEEPERQPLRDGRRSGGAHRGCTRCCGSEGDQGPGCFGSA